jgi:hypothetical protein
MNFHMAGRTGARAAAEATDLKAMLTDDFHDPPAFNSIENMAHIIGVYDLNHAHISLLFASPDVCLAASNARFRLIFQKTR